MSTESPNAPVPRLADHEPGPPVRHGLVLLTLSIGFFMTVLDVTIVNIAVPDLISGLSSSFNQVLWILNAYTLVFAVLLLVSGRLGDALGARRLLVWGLALFTVASALCGAAQDSGQLIAARALQGLGAAALMPQTLSILTSLTPVERRGRAFGIWSAIAGTALVAGPTLGGLLVTWQSWRWVFVINVPVGLVAIVLALRHIPPMSTHRRHRLDPLGLILSTAALFCVTYGVIEGQRYEWGTIRGVVSIPAVIVLGVVLWGAFLWCEWLGRAGDPLLPLELLRRRNYLLMNLVIAIVMLAMTGLLLVLTLYLQLVRGMSALEAGLALAPTPVVAVLLSPFVGRLTGRRSGKYALALGLLVFAGALILMAATVATDSDAVTLLPSLLMAGTGMGLVLAPMNTIAMHGIPQHLVGAASGVSSTARQLGTVIGVAAVGALLANRISHELPRAAARRAEGLPPLLRGRFVEAFHDASHRLRLGAGDQRAAFGPPDGLDAAAARHWQSKGGAAFADGFVNALSLPLLLPVPLLALAIVLTALVRTKEAAHD
ncbi:DHA2 family efflux MFS transporter permease subunit [Streptomyces cupreus]|uniref:MFS transporter n=1 Tax=Streptomyces cupreus TaxID=2759956 RepID=A0A7X1MAF5_9ACTN|nr:MFS transporter [Streptomyces cupreus]